MVGPMKWPRLQTVDDSIRFVLSARSIGWDIYDPDHWGGPEGTDDEILATQNRQHYEIMRIWFNGISEHEACLLRDLLRRVLLRDARLLSTEPLRSWLPPLETRDRLSSEEKLGAFESELFDVFCDWMHGAWRTFHDAFRHELCRASPADPCVRFLIDIALGKPEPKCSMALKCVAELVKQPLTEESRQFYLDQLATCSDIELARTISRQLQDG